MEGLLGARQTVRAGSQGGRAIALALFALAIASPALACLNTFSSRIGDVYRGGDPQQIAEEATRVESAHRSAPTLQNTNDLAVARVLTGQRADGIRLLRDLEQRYPGNAVIAANLGTALEL